jgi:hypothetical protein
MNRPENKLRFARLILNSVIGFASMILITGCPYHSSHSLEDSPSNSINTSYLGKWRGSITNEVTGEQTNLRLEISSVSETEYSFELIGRILKRTDKKKRVLIDTLSATGFISQVDNRQILNIKFRDQIYLSDFTYTNDKISIMPLSDHFTSFMIRSNKQLRDVVAYHFKSRINPMYDESACLKNMTRIIE